MGPPIRHSAPIRRSGFTVINHADNHWNFDQACALRGTPAALARNNFKSTRISRFWSHYYWLNDTVRFDRLCKIF